MTDPTMPDGMSASPRLAMWPGNVACRETGPAERFEEFEGDEAAGCNFVVTANLNGDLDPSQRAMIAARRAPLSSHTELKALHLRLLISLSEIVSAHHGSASGARIPGEDFVMPK